MISGINVDVGSILSGLGKVGGLFKDIRAAITGKEILDPNKQAELELKLLEAEASLSNAQTDINKIEAAHKSLFIAGWRPWIGWVCGFAIAWHFILSPVVSWILILAGSTVALPVLEVGMLINLVLAMLGLGGLRTFEKYKGVENNR